MSKLKPVMYWTFVTGWSASGSYPIMAVTTEKPRQVFGRDEHDQSTHRRKSDCTGRFATKEEAVARRGEFIALAERYNELRKPHEDATLALYRQEDAERRDLQNRTAS